MALQSVGVVPVIWSLPGARETACETNRSETRVGILLGNAACEVFWCCR